MKPRLGLRLLLLLPLTQCLSGAYQYTVTDPLTTINPAVWAQNGALSATPQGLTALGNPGGSLIYRGSLGIEYAVATTLRLTQSGGTYVHYVHSTLDSLSQGNTGTYYSVELQNPQFSGGGCTATLAAYKRVNSVVTLLGMNNVPCHDNMVLHTIWRLGDLTVRINTDYYLWIPGQDVPFGQAGVGARETPAGNSIREARLGPRETVPPAQVNPQSVGVSAQTTCLDLQWQGVLDDPNGVGMHFYIIWRDNQEIRHIKETVMTDCGLTPGTVYTYHIKPVDLHYNIAMPIPFTAATAPAGSLEPRRVGVRPLGAYWGALGEQVDMMSGNLNFTLPLFQVRGRGGWSVPFALNYNSQLWRQDAGGTWKLGRDVGYGFGWRLLAGSVTPYFHEHWQAPTHYVFTDSTGAEYRLDINTNGMYTSREGVYVSYDQAAQRLYFNDGSFWEMGCISAGTEEDSGTRYPTLMQDSNGNQISIRYHPGLGLTWDNSSARIRDIMDVRASGDYPIYSFTYNSDPIPHLASITAPAQTLESYTFSYLGGQALWSPFSPQVSYGTATLLRQVTTTGVGVSYELEYGANATGELAKVTLPERGWLRWGYRSFTYAGGRTLREVETRYLSASSTGPESGWTFPRSDGAELSHHPWMAVLDGGSGIKLWWLHGPGPWAGLAQEDRNSGWAVLERRDYGWTQDAAGVPYIGSVLSTIDYGTGNQKQSKTEQALDVYGNVLWRKQYDYGNLSTPARTYTYSYLSGTNYSSRYIRNRLLTAAVSTGGSAVTLVSNVYDGYGQATCYSQLTGYLIPPQRHDSSGSIAESVGR